MNEITSEVLSHILSDREFHRRLSEATRLARRTSRRKGATRGESLIGAAKAVRPHITGWLYEQTSKCTAAHAIVNHCLIRGIEWVSLARELVKIERIGRAEYVSPAPETNRNPWAPAPRAPKYKEVNA